MAKYAANTTVSTSRSQEEIERILKRFGCGKTIWMRDDEEGQAVLAFQRGRLTYKFTLPFPKADDHDIMYTQSRLLLRSKEQQREALDQEVRRKFRSLANYIKAILDAVDSGIINAEEALMPYAVLPGGVTMYQHLLPQLGAMLESGRVPGIVLALSDGRGASLAAGG